MNIERILHLADVIEQRLPIRPYGIGDEKKVGFNMRFWCADSGVRTQPHDFAGHACGTVACIGGHTEMLYGDGDEGDMGAVGELLGLPARTACQLFYPDDAFMTAGWDATPAQAARVLRNLAITGKVDWEAAMLDNDPAMPAVPAKVTLSAEAKEPSEV